MKRGAAFVSGLGFRLAFLIALTVLLTAGGVAVVLVKVQEGDLLNEALHSAERFTTALEASGRYAMLRNQSDDIRQIVAAAGRADGIEAVRVINKGGVVVYSSRPDEVSTRLDLEAEACVTCHARGEPLVAPDGSQRGRIFTGSGGTRVLGYIAPVYNGPECSDAPCHAHAPHQKVLGVIDVQLSLAAMDARAAEEQRRLWVFLAGWVLVLAALFGTVGHAWVTRPVRELADRCRAVAEAGPGEARPLDPRGSGEMRDLAEAFNRMVVELKEAQGTLEEKVLDRTRRLREAEEQIVRTEKLSAVGTLAAGIAHEVNNPLTGIITFARLLLRKAEPGSDAAHKLERIVAEAERCSGIVSSFLDFSRPDEARVTANVRETVEQLVGLLKPQAVFRGVRIECAYAERLPRLAVPSGRLQQVLTNLFKNAVEAGAKEIRLRVDRMSAEAAAGSPAEGGEEGARGVQVVVEDDGPGIPRELLNRVFDPFYTTKPVGEGAGLGLWISYRIVEEMGGRLRVENGERGARFLFTVPAARPTGGSSSV